MVVWVLLSRRGCWTWSTLGRCVHPPTYTVGWVQDEVLAISSRSVSPLDRVGTHLAGLVSLHRDDIRRRQLIMWIGLHVFRYAAGI